MSDLHPEVEHLSQAELKWIKRLERVLNSCPSKRLELFTIGDPTLTVIDGEVTSRHNFDIEDGKAHKNGVELFHIRASMKIHGVSG